MTTKSTYVPDLDPSSGNETLCRQLVKSEWAPRTGWQWSSNTVS